MDFVDKQLRILKSYFEETKLHYIAKMKDGEDITEMVNDMVDDLYRYVEDRVYRVAEYFEGNPDSICPVGRKNR